jgi:hypothetical protein
MAVRANARIVIACALLFPACTLMVGDYSANEMADAGEDRDKDGGQPDGRADDLKDCAPDPATSFYTLLRGPSAECTGELCDTWLGMCLTEGRHYLVLQTDGQFVRWFDRCNLLEFASVNSTVICTSAEGYTVSIGIQGRSHTDAPGGFLHTWSLYHRNITGYEFLAPTEGCGESECEMFSGFQLDPGHRYLARQIDREKVRWFDNCRMVDAGAGDLDELICTEPGEGDELVIQASAPETTSVETLRGSWTVFSEPIDDGGTHTYLAPAPGCGSTACAMWDNFDLDSGHRYMVLQSGASRVRWFDSCSGQFQDPGNQKLRCVSPDGHFIELQTQGDELADTIIEGNSSWSLLRWSLQPN